MCDDTARGPCGTDSNKGEPGLCVHMFVFAITHMVVGQNRRIVGVTPVK